MLLSIFNLGEHWLRCARSVKWLIFYLQWNISKESIESVPIFNAKEINCDVLLKFSLKVLVV